MINLPEEDRARLIDAEWNVADGKDLAGEYSAEIKIYANNRTGVLVMFPEFLRKINRCDDHECENQ